MSDIEKEHGFNSDEDTDTVMDEAHSALVKRSWTPEEDVALMAAVEKYGACRWSIIATHLSSGRVGKQCRERWNNQLSPVSTRARHLNVASRCGSEAGSDLFGCGS